jgi:PAS domain S-box-containing protein
VPFAVAPAAGETLDSSVVAFPAEPPCRMPNTPSPLRQSLALYALLGGAILLVVVLPFLLVRHAHEQADAANDAVSHTARVEVAVQSLMYDLRNRESATLAYAFGHGSPAIRQRLDESRREIPQNLAILRALTRDNPEQQVRVGRLSSVIEQRGQLIETLLAAPPGSADQRDIEWLLDRNPLRTIGKEISDTEVALLDARRARADRLDARSRSLTWGAMAAQLLMLGAAGLARRWLLAARRTAVAAATRSSARAQAVLQTVREPVLVLDRELRVVMHNPAFAEVFGVEVGAIGKPLDSAGESAGAWATPELRQRLVDVLARDRELWDHEVAYREPDGRERVLLVNARRMSLPDSEDQVALVTANDVTAQKAIERRVRELNAQLQGKVDQVSEVNRELEAFSYSVSHDLRAPLRHIGGFADKLARHLGDRNDDRSRHYIEVITTSARRMSRLIDDLLVYSRLGRSALRLQPVDMQTLVDEARAMLDANNASEHPGHRIEWRVQPLPILVGDENMLRQVWQNLLSNAVKYSAGSEPAVVEVTHRRLDGGDYEFTVADNGVGFDMAYAGKLFGVFQRLHAVTEFEGTGIGLASVRRVLARHGGTITADSAPGQGARFTFTRPAPGDSNQLDPT